MNLIKTFLFMILCTLFLSACGKTDNTSTSNSSKKEEIAENKEKLNVKITLNKKIKDNKKILISGKSNLPKETKINIYLDAPSSDQSDLAKVLVKEGGMFNYEFSNEEGEDFDGGKYIAYVETSPENLQTDHVKEIFGEDGANLAGSNVSGEDSRVATAEINFKINNSSKVKQKSKKDNAAEVTNKKDEELSTLKSEAEYEIESIVEDNYKTASIEEIEINEDMGSEKPNKLIALVHLSFDAKNSARTSYNMVEMYSDDLAAKIGSENDTVNQIAVFWKVPYIDEDETLAKFSYERSGEHMIITDKVSSLR
ncbi:hypothetical protein QJS65_20620 (plasmid) [Bacillus altitudinis]|uniref:hypothetical protein n=1 Tax=Bacillus altitudinis TaxID=293387 RepID=UPI0024A8C8E7|nr:hypothetical protein [Bacillus altitudinis]WHF29090.1 hypothetical protein QJS65_20620 [Bacillus altitudinis]